MSKAIWGFFALGLVLASVAANAESEDAKGRAGAFRVESRAHAFNASHGWENSSERRFDFDGDRGERSNRSFEADRQMTKPRSVTPTAVAAPEIDPRSAASALTLLLGGIAVLLGRRKRME